MTSTPQIGPAYLPEELVPITGIYRVTHRPELHDRPPHDAVLIRGEEFPKCRTCHEKVKYEIKVQCSHITHDFDFSGPGRLTLSRLSG
jgi:hypothetical protein